ncbi:MAG: 4-hydroxy-3-methylbut-2-en-1-yl diphosphate synthase [Bacteroidetes bacterium CG2_30_33_31]|nr:MAG: 4-hydroxy-3-methylbut-2-en-1-yl diphosphate synthase [Bacteroidetes bacterium CG2_30_33_31]
MKDKYCHSITKYQRWETREVKIGNMLIGGKNKIALQSMTNHRPLETMANVEQSIRIIDAGGEIVRLTAPTAKDAENLKNIKEELIKKGYFQPLVADIHFNPGAALEAAKWVEKVRINPGNYAEVSKSKVDFTDEEYQEALLKIKEKVSPLLSYCKQNNVAIRIGSNHGSLSQRIMSRYGDTPKGMVEAAMEYLKMAVEMEFFDIVISMKASNIRVMVQAYRYLVFRMNVEKMNFPIHLGVTEAGNGEDGIIKSAAGNGALLYDGIGDTIRVSLTDEPENEIPVAKAIVKYAKTFANHKPIANLDKNPINPFEFSKRFSKTLGNIGGKNVPVVFGKDIKINEDKSLIFNSKSYKILNFTELAYESNLSQEINFVFVEIADLQKSISLLKKVEKPLVLIFRSQNNFWMPELRRMFIYLINNNIDAAVILYKNYSGLTKDEMILRASMDFGPLFIDGFGDGVFIENNSISPKEITDFSLSLLQAARTRFTRADFISCPSCGRTLFDLQEATAQIKAATDHLVGVKIGIMGCIVNGPGEMADADYGYVGAGPNKINLYKGKEVVIKNIPQNEAVNQLIELIKAGGDWK